jgi:hypothetical protein
LPGSPPGAAGAGDVPELAAEIAKRSERICRLRAQVEAASRTPELVADQMAKTERKARERLLQLRHALSAQPDGAREAYLALFPGGIRFVAQKSRGQAPLEAPGAGPNILHSVPSGTFLKLGLDADHFVVEPGLARAA